MNSEESKINEKLWEQMPPFKDAESCVGAGLSWAIKLCYPQTEIPLDVEAQINSRKLGQCKDNIPFSWILGTVETFPEVPRFNVYVDSPDYADALSGLIPAILKDRINVQFNAISSETIKAGELGICALLTDKGILQGGMHIAHTVVVDPKITGQENWLTYSDPWSGRQEVMVPDRIFDEALFGLKYLVGWGLIAVSASPKK